MTTSLVFIGSRPKALKRGAYAIACGRAWHGSTCMQSKRLEPGGHSGWRGAANLVQRAHAAPSLAAGPGRLLLLLLLLLQRDRHWPPH